MATIDTTTGAVIFDYSAWASLYPSLSTNVGETLAQSYFDVAGLSYLNNSYRSIVKNTDKRLYLLGLLVAHLAMLFLPESKGGLGGSNVGRLASATRGSVSVSYDFSSTTGDQWYLQTQYGATFWAATACYRTMRLIPGRAQPSRIFP